MGLSSKDIMQMHMELRLKYDRTVAKHEEEVQEFEKKIEKLEKKLSTLQ